VVAAKLCDKVEMDNDKLRKDRRTRQIEIKRTLHVRIVGVKNGMTDLVVECLKI